MPLVRKNNKLDKKTSDDLNIINEEKDDAPVANGVVEELECNNENAPHTNVGTTYHISNIVDTSSLDRCQSSNLDNKRHTYLLDNRIDCVKSKTCLPNEPFMKIAHSVNRSMFEF